MKRNVSVSVSRCNILVSGKIIKELLGSVASGTPCTKSKKMNGTKVKIIEAQQAKLRNNYTNTKLFSYY